RRCISSRALSSSQAGRYSRGAKPTSLGRPMPWKIVNLDYGARPHLHLKDPNAPIHMRAFFADQRVEIGLGEDDPEDCFVRATVTPDDVVVHATKFEAVHVQILSSILASLDVEPTERDA